MRLLYTVAHSSEVVSFVQKKIYVDELGGTRNYNKKIWYEFCDRVGWRKGGNYVSYSDLTFELLSATQLGHLPANLGQGLWLVSAVGSCCLLSRAKTCKL